MAKAKSKKKEKTRFLGECRTIGQLIADLKKNFHPNDNVSILTLVSVKHDAVIESNSCTSYNGTVINHIGYSLQNIKDWREEQAAAEKKDEE